MCKTKVFLLCQKYHYTETETVSYSFLRQLLTNGTKKRNLISDLMTSTRTLYVKPTWNGNFSLPPFLICFISYFVILRISLYTCGKMVQRPFITSPCYFDQFQLSSEPSIVEKEYTSSVSQWPPLPTFKTPRLIPSRLHVHPKLFLLFVTNKLGNTLAEIDRPLRLEWTVLLYLFVKMIFINPVFSVFVCF